MAEVLAASLANTGSWRKSVSVADGAVMAPDSPSMILVDVSENTEPVKSPIKSPRQVSLPSKTDIPCVEE